MRIRGWCLSLLYLIQSFAKKVGIAASSDDKPARHIIPCPDLPPPVTSLEYADLATSKFAMPRNYFLKDSCASSAAKRIGYILASGNSLLSSAVKSL